MSYRAKVSDLDLFPFFLRILGVLVFVALPSMAHAQSHSPEATPRGDFEVSSSVEIGFRGLDLEGNENKYRSDLNYRRGFRVFDSSFFVRAKEGTRSFFDTFVINTSGFGADRSGATRFSLDKAGIYRFDGNFRRIAYFNKLANIGRGAHTKDINHDLGDLDLTIYPIANKLEIIGGVSWDQSEGPGTWTIRGFRSNASDEWAVDVDNRTRAKDFRIGMDGELSGFNLSLLHGYRMFRDNTNFTISSLNVGFHPGTPTSANTSVITSFLRQMPVRGDSHYTTFNLQRTFAKRADLTTRFVYATGETKSQMTELITGRDSQNNFVDLDRFDGSGTAKRIEKRADIGFTVRATDKFRISDSFTFDTFGIDGGGAFFAATQRRSATGAAQVVAPANNTGYRLTNYRRATNLLEAHYQVSNRLGFHLGYRFTQREVTLERIDLTLTSPPSATNPDIRSETESNHTHTGIAGMKLAPTNRWTVYADVEVGEADNAFTRVGNYKFTNLRARSRWIWGKFGLNLSAISRDNENPSFSTNPQAPSNPATGGAFISNVKNRTFSGDIDWTPVPELTVSAGYNYQRLTAETDIVINVGTAGLQRGLSQYYIRDHFFNFDISARPNKFVTFYASYRRDDDRGQGGRIATTPNFIISSYPFKFHTPEAKVSFRLHRKLDWMIGYQYYRYSEDILNSMPLRYPPFTISTGTSVPLLLTDIPGPQNYRAHMPYTSLRFYFGRSADR